MIASNLQPHSKISPSLAAGAGEVVTNPEFLGFNSISTMQDMNSFICERALVGETARLRDTRDDKLYWVSKLADGNCWMTQNLDLDLKGRTLTPTDSDVSSNWSGASSVASGLWSDTTSNIIKWYDAGMYVYTKPTIAKDCGASSSGLSGGTCAADGWVDVSGETMKASNDPSFGIEVADNTYNAHYLAGNRYSWNAATAGQASSLPNQYDEATQSICPKGWTLPKSGRSAENVLFTSSGTFANLFESYSWQWNQPNSGNKYYTNTFDGGSGHDLRLVPFYFLYGGLVNSGRLYNAGSSGYYWSSTAYSGTNAYSLYFNSSSVYPSNNYTRYFGVSVRCVAK